MTPRRAVDADARRMSLPGAVLWSLLLVFLNEVCVELTDALRPGAGGDVVNLTACRVLATSAALFVIARVYAPTSSLRTAFGIRPFPVIHAPLAAVAGAGIAPLLSTLDDAILRRWPYDAQALESMQTLFSRSSHAALIVGAFVALPLAHEAFFQGALFEQLRRSLGLASVAGATAILFAGSSLDPRAMPSALALGTVLGWIRARSGSAVGSAVAHLSFLAVYAIPIARGGDPAADVVYPRSWILGGAALALVALAAFALPAKRPTSS
jgi:membrane protease YdiL (CAAX protease family)